MNPDRTGLSAGAKSWLGLFFAGLAAWILLAYQNTSPVLIAVLGFSILTMAVCWLISKDASNEEKWILLILAAGFLLKLIYVIYTGVGTRQHDVHNFAKDTNGHAGYIKYLYTYGHLPDFDPREQFQFYHPPLHHILAAIWVKFNQILGEPIEQCWKNIQVLTLFYSSACMILMYRILKELDFKGPGLLLSLLVFSFHPYFIFLAGSVNNDTLAILFMMLAILYTIRWSKSPTFRNIVPLALAFGLGMSTKLSVAYLAPATALVFLWKWVRTKERLLPQFAVFALICLPLGLWWYIRCYVLFDLPFGYVPALSVQSSQYLGARYSLLDRLFDLSGEQFQNLYISYGHYDLPYLEHNIFIALLKSSVFEEQTLSQYNVQILPASFLLFYSNLVLVGFSLYGMIRGLICRSGRFGSEIRLTLLVSYGVVFLAFISFCLSFPHVCTQSFRYMTPTLFVGIIGLGCVWETGGNWTKRIMTGATILFCFSSLAQFLLLGL